MSIHRREPEPYHHTKDIPTTVTDAAEYLKSPPHRSNQQMEPITTLSILPDYDLNKSLMTNTKAGDLIVSKLTYPERDCISTDWNTPVDAALDIMAKRGIHSLPIKKEGKFQGILNMGDIVAHMTGYKPARNENEPEKEMKDENNLNFPCGYLIGLTWESRWLVVMYDNEPLTEVIPKLLQGTHRSLVAGLGWWQVLSQWDFLVWLAKHRNLEEVAGEQRYWLGNVVNATLAELGFESKGLATLSTKLTAKEAFRKVVEAGVSAMPVVDSSGKLLATLSISDVRGLNESKLRSLHLPILEFLESLNLVKIAQVTADKNIKFGELLNRIQVRDVHRVWLVDEHHKPTGVISLTDILRKLNEWLHIAPKALPSPSPAVAMDTTSTEHQAAAATSSGVQQTGGRDCGCGPNKEGCTCGPNCPCPQIRSESSSSHQKKQRTTTTGTK